MIAAKHLHKLHEHVVCTSFDASSRAAEESTNWRRNGDGVPHTLRRQLRRRASPMQSDSCACSTMI
jgi:hypothetical protein